MPVHDNDNRKDPRTSRALCFTTVAELVETAS